MSLSVPDVAILGIVLGEVRSALGHWEGAFLIMASAVMHGFLILSGLPALTRGLGKVIHRYRRKKHRGW